MRFDQLVVVTQPAGWFARIFRRFIHIEAMVGFATDVREGEVQHTHCLFRGNLLPGDTLSFHWGGGIDMEVE